MSKDSIAISIQDLDILRLAENIEQFLIAGVSSLFIDVDQCLVPNNFAIGPQAVDALRSYGIKCPIHVYLKGNVPIKAISSFSQSGVNTVIVDADVAALSYELLSAVSQSGCKVGIAVSSTEPLCQCNKQLISVDCILVKESGCGDQGSVMSLKEVSERSLALSKMNRRAELMVSGKINTENIPLLSESKASLFILDMNHNGSDDYYSVISRVKQSIQEFN